MDCADIANLIHAFVDDELEAGPAAEMAAHLRHCPQCARLVEDQRQLSRAVRREATRHAAPERLRARILAGVAAEAAAEPSGEPSETAVIDKGAPLPERSDAALGVPVSGTPGGSMSHPGVVHRIAPIRAP